MTNEIELFGHDQLGELKAFADSKVEELRSFHAQACDSLEATIRAATDHLTFRVKAGLVILELKARFSKHGNWTGFCESRLGWLHERTRQRYQAAAEAHLRGELPIEQPRPENLQLCFEGLDFKPLPSGKSGTAGTGKSDKAVVFATTKFSNPFWNFEEKHPFREWPREEKDTFAVDTAKRVKLLADDGIELPEIIDIEPA
jgi:hypothetical protein